MVSGYAVSETGGPGKISKTFEKSWQIELQFVAKLSITKEMVRIEGCISLFVYSAALIVQVMDMLSNLVYFLGDMMHISAKFNLKYINPIVVGTYAEVAP